MEKMLTVLVAQYRPDPQALRRTLASLAMQATRDFAVVLADDGSPQPFFEESKAWLAGQGIHDVQAVAMVQNGGTVRNILNALQAVNTRWVLTLSTMPIPCPGGWNSCGPMPPGWPLGDRPITHRGRTPPPRRGRPLLTAPPMTRPGMMRGPSSATCCSTMTASAAVVWYMSGIC